MRRVAVTLMLAMALGASGCSGPAATTPLPTATQGDSATVTASVGVLRPDGSAGAASANRSGNEGALDAVPQELIVSLEPGAAVPLDLGDMGHATLRREMTFTHPVAVLTLPDGVSTQRASEYLRSCPGVLSVLPNLRIAKRSVTPPANDPLLPSQWPYGPDRADVYGAWSLLDTLAASASLIASTTVAVLDTGVDPGHPDLNVLPGYNAANPLVNGAVDTASFRNDEDDHGTGCAGVVAARRGNALGAAGVAPGVAILPVKLTDSTNKDGGLAAILFGFEIAAYYNRSDSPYPNLANPAAGKVRVINLSYGPSMVGRLEPFDAALEFLRQRGIVVCVAAGNDDFDGRVEVPANSPAAIGVSATFDYQGWELPAPYTSYGPEIWVAGPGNFIWSTAKKGTDRDYSNAYQLFNGTSASAPFVAGVAALINIRYGTGQNQDSAQWADKVKQRLADTADDLGTSGFDPYFGHGRVNARRAIGDEVPFN